jgi:hypothetical protein
MLKRLRKYTVLALLGNAWAWPAAMAQKRAAVTVSVELVAQRYRDRFANRQAVEAKAATLFAEYLTKNVGFLRFAPDDSTRPYRLAFLLDRLDRTSTSGFSEVGFWVHLDRVGEAPVEAYWLQFRGADQALAGVGTEVQFLTEIKSKLAHRDADSLRTGVLRWIPVSETGLLPDLQPVGVVLPFPLLELCMKHQSIVEFLAEFGGAVTREEPFKARVEGTYTPTGPSTPDVEPFRGGGFAKVVDITAPNDLSLSISQHSVKVKKIFVTAYIHDQTACDNRTPLAVGGSAP